MNGPRDYSNKWSKLDRGRHMISYMWNLKNDKNENNCKTETHRFQKKTYGHQKEW